jgi:hypothetical protein
MESPKLEARQTEGGGVVKSERGWHLRIEAGSSKSYRLAQLDDHGSRSRQHFTWRAPVTLSLRARVSAALIQGTWGFGLWNNPFGLACSPEKRLARLPALPHAAWFFSASRRSYLSLRNDRPANGFFAQVFRSGALGGWIVPATLGLLLDTQRARRRLSNHVAEEAVEVGIDPCAWHQYELHWQSTSIEFRVDQRLLLKCETSPKPPLGLVLWIDNQYAAFDPQGRLAWGFEASNEAAWMDIEALKCESRPAAP